MAHDLENHRTSYIVFTRWNARKCRERQGISLQNADVAQLVEHHLAKVDVASSNLVVRSQDTVTAKILRNRRLHGGLAERRGSGLQSRIHGFESRTHLGENHGFRIISGWTWAIGAAVARFPDTEEVTGSIPVSPTSSSSPGSCFFLARPPPRSYLPLPCGFHQNRARSRQACIRCGRTPGTPNFLGRPSRRR